MKTKDPKDISKAARDSAGIEAAMRRAVAKTLDERRKLGQPIVTQDNGTIHHVTNRPK